MRSSIHLLHHSVVGSRRPDTVGARSLRGRRTAFSLIELMAVMAIISLMAGFVVPAVKGIFTGTTVDVGATKLSGMLNLARSQAIAQHTIVRFVVATNWPTTDGDNTLRRVSLWTWNADSGTYLQTSNWEELPVGLVLETEIPSYIRTASYATNDASTVRGSSVLSNALAGSATFSADTNIGTISTRYIEFLPNGSASIPGSTDRQAIFVATPGYADAGNHITRTAQVSGQSANWAQINVDTLTGRTHVYRP